MKKHIPNIITTIRLILACIFPIVFIYDAKSATIIFIIAAISDSIDGFLARKWDVVSEYGKRIDPIADKLLVAAALVLILIFINKCLYITLILEGIISLTNVYIYNKTNDFNVIKIGKIKAIFLYPLIILGLLTYFYSDINMIFYIFLVITTLLQISTIVNYIKSYKNK